ncbi:MAG: hypothetical protein AB2A00_23390 [Myxococcota bacterium]
MESRTPSTLTPAQKLRAVLQLRESAMELKAAWFRLQHPEWSEEQVRHEVRKVFMHARDD